MKPDFGGDLRLAHGHLCSWLMKTALPYWANHGVDRGNGGFFEKIDRSGRPTDEPRRTRLVARQTYVFAQAHRFGLLDDALDLVDHGLTFFETRCLAPDGTVRAAVMPDGTVFNPDFELYDHAFALFALAEVARIHSDRARLAAIARRIRDAMVEGWKHPIAGFERRCPRILPLEANPHMHLFEAFLAWMEVDPADGTWRHLAEDIASLALDRLVDSQSGALREFWDGDWMPILNPEGRLIEPGHHFEWAWLLLRWDEKVGAPDAARAAHRLVEIGESHGIDPRGLVIAELWDDFSLRDNLARLWPQTERLKAHLRWASHTVDKAACRAAEARAAAAAEGLARFLVTEIPGLWWDAMRTDGDVVAEPTKASSLYHVVCAVGELHSYLGAPQSRFQPIRPVLHL
jgi:mannose/cellobiose epimerase-like protein (N-acyl-D-glucosamine 2-epimerase family)